uniref:Uncharacterized protein n=1 Tax=viral metagenome TaxID=1070528 RepID=A0A6M3LG76_9ZZZZ
MNGTTEEKVLEDNTKTWSKLVDEYVKVSTTLKTVTMEKDSITEKMKQYMEKKDAEVIVCEAGTVHWKTVPGGRQFDPAALEEAAPLDQKKVKKVLQALPKVQRAKILDQLELCLLDLNQFYKQKADSRPFKPKFS